MKTDLSIATIILIALFYATWDILDTAMNQLVKPIYIMGPEFGPRPNCDGLDGNEWQECHGVEPK